MKSTSFKIGDRVSFIGGFYDAIVVGTVVGNISTDIVTIYQVQLDDEFSTHFHSSIQTKYQNHLLEVSNG